MPGLCTKMLSGIKGSSNGSFLIKCTNRIFSVSTWLEW
ncbi:Uncharacterised protein [Vibrio cholerae]|nr:Uncharacterised protein [Vibrio cholerae]